MYQTNAYSIIPQNVLKPILQNGCAYVGADSSIT